jgi:hypothetical protein
MQVVKRSGEMEEFDPNKTFASLMRAGIPSNEADRVIEQLRPCLYEGISTDEIYRRINQLLDERKRVRFGLKKAIMDLGPDGYLFEDFIARLFQEMGYEVRTRQMVPGQCVQHEIDVLIKKGPLRHMVECKFHNSQGIKCSIQTALYTYGRFLDIAHAHGLESPWLVTNTHFSSDVMRYASCMNMHLLGWRYPEKEGLETLVERYRLYPITILDVRRSDLRTLMQHGLVLARDILNEKEKVRRLLQRSDVQNMFDSVAELIE